MAGAAGTWRGCHRCAHAVARGKIRRRVRRPRARPRREAAAPLPLLPLPRRRGKADAWWAPVPAAPRRPRPRRPPLPPRPAPHVVEAAVVHALRDLQLERRCAAAAAVAAVVRRDAPLQRDRRDAARGERGRLHQQAHTRVAREVGRLGRRRGQLDDGLAVLVQLVRHGRAQGRAVGGERAQGALVDDVDDRAGRLGGRGRRGRAATVATSAVLGAVHHGHGAHAAQRGRGPSRGWPAARGPLQLPAAGEGRLTDHAVAPAMQWGGAVDCAAGPGRVRGKGGAGGAWRGSERVLKKGPTNPECRRRAWAPRMRGPHDLSGI
jgi:hypothetical protein